MALLFSYGSNYPEQLAERLGRNVETWPAYTDGFERVFRNYSTRWGGGVASLVPSPDARTLGHVTRVSAEDFRILDAREGVPMSYLRTEIPVVITQGPTEAQVYIARSNEFHRPSRAYLEAVARTISEHWEPVDWRDIPIR
jgi:cation transport regulator ChaC